MTGAAWMEQLRQRMAAQGLVLLERGKWFVWGEKPVGGVLYPCQLHIDE